jgi:tetratricopeptide (TPR) repeat protein
LTLALLRLQQDRAAEAWPLLRKAAALAADDFFTQYTFGLSLLRANPPAGDAGEDPLELAHGALARAVALNPESAEALGWLAYADLVADKRLPEAETAIAKAIALSPGRIDYRLRLAEVYLRRNRVVVARSLLSTIAASKSDDEAAGEARKLLDRIEARERERIAGTGAATRRVPEPSPEAPARETLQLEPEAGVRFALRKVRAGEERAYGELVEIACAPGGVQFHLRVGARVVVAVAPAMKDVELTVYGNDKDFTLACGARTPADTVLLTWRMKAPTQPGAATLVGDAVAVEFVPRGYVP